MGTRQTDEQFTQCCTGIPKWQGERESAEKAFNDFNQPKNTANAEDDQGHKGSVVALVAFCNESKAEICQNLSPFGNQTTFWQ